MVDQVTYLTPMK